MSLLFQICLQKPSWINVGYKSDNNDDDDNDVDVEEGDNNDDHDNDADVEEGGNKERHVWISCGCCLARTPFRSAPSSTNLFNWSTYFIQSNFCLHLYTLLPAQPTSLIYPQVLFNPIVVFYYTLLAAWPTFFIGPKKIIQYKILFNYLQSNSGKALSVHHKKNITVVRKISEQREPKNGQQRGPLAGLWAKNVREKLTGPKICRPKAST